MAHVPFPVQVLNPTTSEEKRLTVPSDGVTAWLYVEIYVEGADIRWVDHPADTLSSSEGIRLGDGKSLRYQGDFKNWRCIAVSGTPTVRVKPYAI